MILESIMIQSWQIFMITLTINIIISLQFTSNNLKMFDLLDLWIFVNRRTRIFILYLRVWELWFIKRLVYGFPSRCICCNFRTSHIFLLQIVADEPTGSKPLRGSSGISLQGPKDLQSSYARRNGLKIPLVDTNQQMSAFASVVLGLMF